jgi:hypothetical protein
MSGIVSDSKDLGCCCGPLDAQACADRRYPPPAGVHPADADPEPCGCACHDDDTGGDDDDYEVMG